MMVNGFVQRYKDTFAAKMTKPCDCVASSHSCIVLLLFCDFVYFSLIRRILEIAFLYCSGNATQPSTRDTATAVLLFWWISTAKNSTLKTAPKRMNNKKMLWNKNESRTSQMAHKLLLRLLERWRKKNVSFFRSHFNHFLCLRRRNYCKTAWKQKPTNPLK